MLSTMLAMVLASGTDAAGDEVAEPCTAAAACHGLRSLFGCVFCGCMFACFAASTTSPLAAALVGAVRI